MNILFNNIFVNKQVQITNGKLSHKLKCFHHLIIKENTND